MSPLHPAPRLSHGAVLGDLRRAFAHCAGATRVHAIGRFLSCPYLRTLHHVPLGASILDIGAGHGVFALLALRAGASSVTALEPDLRKVPVAAREPGIEWVAGRVESIAGHFDVITLHDVLYRIPPAERDRLLAEALQRLRPGGVLLIKELDPGRRLKAAWNRMQEWISDGFLDLTLGSGFYYESTAQLSSRLLGLGFVDCTVEDIGRGYPHAHVLYVARAPGPQVLAAVP